MKKIRISELPLSESTKGLYLLATDRENQSVKVSMDSMSEERAAADAELLKRIIGKSTASSAYSDPFKYLRDYQSEKDANGTITKHAIRVMQDALLDTLRHSDYRESFPYIGNMRAHVEGVPIDVWNYVKSWNTASNNGVFVQVVRTNFGLKNGVISSALTESFHEYYRTVTVGMANGSVTDVTATAWKESNADAALAQIAEEAKARAAADAALQEQIQSNEDLAREGISKAESASAMLFEEEAARKEADKDLNDLIDAEVTERLQSVETEKAARQASDAELQAKMQDHEDRIWKLENQWYGIEWDTEVSSPAVTRIGNMDLHRTLPIQSRMRGCLLDDNGKVTKYLNPKDWTGEVRDGSRGQVMVEIPMHYRRCETEGTKRRVKLSEYPLPGFLPIPRMYPSAYEASLQHSTNKLCSVVNTDPDFRGGDNNAAWDGTYRSLLGSPITKNTFLTLRSCARNRKSGSTAWNCYTYDVHKTIFWLFVVEYATFNSQAAYNSEPTSEGYRQGGLGAGVTNFDGSTWSSFNNYNPFVPCGHTDSLGNRTGVVPFSLSNDDSLLSILDVPRYRGVENPFGHIWKWTDGCECIIQSEASGGLSKFYVCDDPAKFTESGVSNYDYRGDLPRKEGYVRNLILGEDGDIMPLEVGGGSTTYLCDYFYTSIPSSGEAERSVLFGGAANYSELSGFVFANTYYSTDGSGSSIGTRLCFLPAE